MRPLITVLAFAGLVVSVLAFQVHYATGTQPCDINDHWDCGIVNHSSYSVIHHVPVAAIGIAGYLLLGILALARRRIWLFAASLLGLLYALHLSSIEKNVLQVWCLYCVISQCIIALITILCLAWLIAERASRMRARKLA
jgi:vitamin-K-epoxide reductase (warfarin-sensitive)